MSAKTDICDETGCALPAVILVAGVGYCATHALAQVGRIPLSRPERTPSRRPKPKRPFRPNPTEEIS